MANTVNSALGDKTVQLLKDIHIVSAAMATDWIAEVRIVQLIDICSSVGQWWPSCGQQRLMQIRFWLRGGKINILDTYE